MQKRIYSFIIVLAISFSSIGIAQAEKQGYWSWLFTFKRQKEIVPVTDELFLEECGACHFPYQPGWLPEASWKKLLSAKGLENHFKENAELEETDRLHILNVLVSGSAEKSRFKRSKKIMSTMHNYKGEGGSPLRITETPYIKNKHRKVVEDIIKPDNKLKSLSYCDKCHQKANDADFDDDTVRIPGFPDYKF
ncbi:MAG: cytochrome C [Thiohalomonadales bacterium]